jgi:hypothetical protein
MAAQRERRSNRPAEADPSSSSNSDTDTSNVTGGAPDEADASLPSANEPAPKPRRKRQPRFVLRRRSDASCCVFMR